MIICIAISAYYNMRCAMCNVFGVMVVWEVVGCEFVYSLFLITCQPVSDNLTMALESIS
jgi:hypothetical protein